MKIILYIECNTCTLIPEQLVQHKIPSMKEEKEEYQLNNLLASAGTRGAISLGARLASTSLFTTNVVSWERSVDPGCCSQGGEITLMATAFYCGMRAASG